MIMVLAITAIYLAVTSLFVMSLLLAAARPTPKPQRIIVQQVESLSATFAKSASPAKGLPGEYAVGLQHRRQ
jgi:hypothetical protein